MNEQLNKHISILITSILALIFSVLFFAIDMNKITSPRVSDPNYTQPTLPFGKYPWNVRSIDTEIVSKTSHLSDDAIKKQVGLLKDLGANYIAISTLYDETNEIKKWADEIHAQGLRVWFRGSWGEWKGEAGKPPIMVQSEYLEETYRFILENPGIFSEGDSFSFASTPEVVGVGLGEKFMNWNEHKRFLLKGMFLSEKAFREVGLEGKVHTNWLPVTESVVLQRFDAKFLKNIGLITVDVFGGQSQTIGQLEDTEKFINQIEKDLDSIYRKYKTPILISGWGYHIYQNVSEEKQAAVIEALFEKLKHKPYLVGINYWLNVRGTSAIISRDEDGNLEYKKAAGVIKLYYDPDSPPLEASGSGETVTAATESAELVEN